MVVFRHKSGNYLLVLYSLCKACIVELWGEVIVCLIKKAAKTLVIIGNGFDLAHGYKTDYKSFVDNTKSAHLDRFRSYCDDFDMATWYLFEDSIKVITEQLFLQSMEEDCDYETNRKELSELNEDFNEIQRLLADYLTKEIARKPFVKKASIERYAAGPSTVINFNYTDTAEHYFKNVYYVHGSLKESDILLGYDYRDEPCLAYLDDTRWSKEIRREGLAFRRYYLGKKHLAPNCKEYKELFKGFELYLSLATGGRGIDGELLPSIPKHRTICRFFERYDEDWSLPKMDYNAVEKVVVLGHGIEADRVYLNRILEKCPRLNKAIIFRYDTESDESYNSKRDFFSPYCQEIEEVYY